MILVVLFWIITSFICLTFGHICLSVIRKFCPIESTDPLDLQWFFQFTLGISAITFLGNIVNNWIAISLAFFISISVISLLYSVYNLRAVIKLIKRAFRYVKEQSVIIHLSLFVVIIIGASKTTMLTENMDEMGYYLSTVKWIESGPTVPGVALLNGRLAINSAWHMSSAIFAFDFLYEGGAYDLNALMFCFVFIIGLKAGLRLYKSESTSVLADLLLLSALVFPFHNLIDSMDADYPSIFIGICLISQVLRRIDHKHLLRIDSGYYIYLIVSLFLFTVKPFSGLFLLYPLFVSLRYSLRNKHVHLIILAVISFLYVLPWLYKNYLISGYVIFPVGILDVFDPEWKLPIEYVRNMSLVVSEFAKVELIRADYLYNGVGHLDVIDWFPTWIDNNWKLAIGKFIIITWPICAILVLSETVLLKNKSSQWIFKLILFLVTLFWFLYFPSIRFGWAFLLSFIILSISDITNYLKISNKSVFYAVALLVSLSLCRNSIKTMKMFIDHPHLFVPEPTPTLKNYKTIKTNMTYYQSETEYCYDILPCVPGHNPWTIYQRTTDMSDGFILRKETDQ
jgi:hypothetical protein